MSKLRLIYGEAFVSITSIVRKKYGRVAHRPGGSGACIRAGVELLRPGLLPAPG